MTISLVSLLPFPWIASPYTSSTSTFSPAELGLEYIICGCLLIMYPIWIGVIASGSRTRLTARLLDFNLGVINF